MKFPQLNLRLWSKFRWRDDQHAIRNYITFCATTRCPFLLNSASNILWIECFIVYKLVCTECTYKQVDGFCREYILSISVHYHERFMGTLLFWTMNCCGLLYVFYMRTRRRAHIVQTAAEPSLANGHILYTIYADVDHSTCESQTIDACCIDSNGKCSLLRGAKLHGAVSAFRVVHISTCIFGTLFDPHC